MAQHVEPMDVDSEFDNKENSYRHGNVPCTEKGYEELDVSEVNMKLRYSVTPHASPMSKSYTAHVDNRIRDADDLLNNTNENANLTRSLNSTMTHDTVIKSFKSLPLQTISTDQAPDNRSSVLRQLDSTVTGLDHNETITISGTTDIDENLSLPSSSSSAAHTPEATTPTNITRNEEGSPIIRGLKSVFNMFRSSQSPIPPEENHDTPKQEIGQLDETYCEDQKTQNLASTPMSAHRNKDSSSSKRNSPLKDSIIFNDDLETEIQWKEDTILFSDEKIPIHKLLLPNTKLSKMGSTPQTEQKLKRNLDTTVEYMDVSLNNSMALENTITPHGVDSDGEFVDCETTFTKTETQNGESNVVVSDTIKEFVTELESIVNVTKNIENMQSEALKQLEPLGTENNYTAKENAETKEIKPKINVMKDVDNVTTFSQTVSKPEATPTQDTNARQPEETTISDSNDDELEFLVETFHINNTSVENVTEKELSIGDFDIPEALVAVADSTEVNVVTTSYLIKTDLTSGSGNISNEDLSQTTEYIEGDINATITDDIDKMIMILQQIEHEETIDVKNGDSTDSHIDKTVKEERKTTESQERGCESNLSNQNRSHVKEPANIPLPDDDDDVALKTENTNGDQHGLNLPSEKKDILNETNDIVNSLTEIIGESLNNTLGMLHQSHIVKQLQGSQFPNEKEALPDLINETIKSTDLIESIETVPASTQTLLIAKSDNVEEVCKDVSFSEKLIPEQKSKPEAKEDDIRIAILKDIDETSIDEEIILSENNSPFVSVTAELELETAEDNLDQTDLPIVTKEVPSSPPIRSKGYNFNFDEMDDPFATATKRKMSPPPTTYKVNESNTVHKIDNITIKAVPNRRRSQPPERKRPTMNRKNNNTTFDAGSMYDQYSEGDTKHLIKDSMEINVTENKEVSKVLDFTQVLDKTIEENLDSSPEVQVEENQPLADCTVKVISETKSEPESIIKPIKEDNSCSSENSNYYSAGSSSDNSILKNVFNLPEIDDKNFNPFATKSKMRQSPPIDLKTPFTTQSKLNSSPNSNMVIVPTENTLLPIQNVKEQEHEDQMDIKLMEKDASYDISNSSSLSNSGDNKNVTTREVNTEDEDTEEGPFLEADEAINNILEIDNDNMMQFNEIPTQASEGNADGELFIDAEAFEFLLNQNQCNVVADSGKESLFLKFDPLFAKRMSPGGEIFAALSQVQKRQSTPTKPSRPSLRNEASPIAGPSNLNTTNDAETNVTQDSIEDLNITVAKPMMVVTPAVNAAVTPRIKTTTPPRSNRRSINFTSSAMAVIDRLLSLSGSNSLIEHDTTVTTQTNREHAEADLALVQLRELLAEKEISVYQLRSESKELKDRLSTMETQVKILEADGQDRLNKINELNDRLVEKTKINKSMAAVVEEYERTIASLIAETEQDKKRHAEERMRLISERDEQTAHLASMEVSFSDLHSKYEKSKHMILSCKANEEICKKSIRDFEENLGKMQLNYEALKQHATSKLNHANKEFQRIAKAHESEVLKHNALIKRKDMHITSLEETLAQKTKANEELTAICDELINKVG